MSKIKSACDTATATSTKQNNSTLIISSAKEKINSLNAKNFKSPKSKAILEPVKKMLAEFSEQQEEFARAVSDVSNLKKPYEIVEFEKQYQKFLEDIKNVRNNSKRTA